MTAASPSPEAVSTSGEGTTAPVEEASSEPFSLYVHCGIFTTEYDGRNWTAVPGPAPQLPARTDLRGAHGERAAPRPQEVDSRSCQAAGEAGDLAASRQVPTVAATGEVARSARPSEVAAREVYGLGVRTDLVTACRIALGVGSTTAYALAARGELPFAAHRVGRQWVVPTAGLLTFLGLPPQEPPTPSAT